MRHPVSGWGRGEPGALGSSHARTVQRRHAQGRPVSAALRPVHLDSRLDARVEAADLARDLRTHAQGDVLFDAASRGRYATDASIYQIEPVGVFVPEREEDALTALQIAASARCRCWRAAAAPRNAGRRWARRS
jgi:hypothetical protein